VSRNPFLDRRPESEALAPEAHLLEPTNVLPLGGDDLRLPNQGCGEEAHGHRRQREHDRDLGFACGNTKGAGQPSHGVSFSQVIVATRTELRGSTTTIEARAERQGDKQRQGQKDEWGVLCKAYKTNRFN